MYPFRLFLDGAGLGIYLFDVSDGVPIVMRRSIRFPLACRRPSYGVPCLGFQSDWGLEGGAVKVTLSVVS